MRSGTAVLEVVRKKTQTCGWWMGEGLLFERLPLETTHCVMPDNKLMITAEEIFVLWRVHLTVLQGGPHRFCDWLNWYFSCIYRRVIADCALNNSVSSHAFSVTLTTLCWWCSYYMLQSFLFIQSWAESCFSRFLSFPLSFFFAHWKDREVQADKENTAARLLS